MVLVLMQVLMTRTKSKHHDVSTTTVCSCPSRYGAYCDTSVAPVSPCVYCAIYRDRLSPRGLVVNLSRAERGRLCGHGRLRWLVQLHAQKPHRIKPHHPQTARGKRSGRRLELETMHENVCVCVTVQQTTD